MRKEKLAEGSIYHIFSKSIAGYIIFNDNNEYARMLEGMRFYQMGKPLLSFARFCECSKEKQYVMSKATQGENQVDIIAYCLMPTHIHFILKQKKEEGISFFMKNLLNSHTRYFNKKHGRKGPLWEGRFKNVLVDDDKQLIHLSRYIHLNPVTTHIIENPTEWKHSSYKEYLGIPNEKPICHFKDLINIGPEDYSEFVKDHIAYQRELALIKKLILD